jgi:Flp pilus assembly pilin Flp
MEVRRFGCITASPGAVPGHKRSGSKVFLRLYVGTQVRWLGLRERVVDESGATAVEYAIMLAFIAAIIVAAVAYLGQATNSQFEKVTFEPA